MRVENVERGGTYVDFYDVGRDDSFEDELGDSVAYVHCGRR